MWCSVSNILAAAAAPPSSHRIAIYRHHWQLFIKCIAVCIIGWSRNRGEKYAFSVRYTRTSGDNNKVINIMWNTLQARAHTDRAYLHVYEELAILSGISVSRVCYTDLHRHHQCAAPPNGTISQLNKWMVFAKSRFAYFSGRLLALSLILSDFLNNSDDNNTYCTSNIRCK